MRWEYLDKKKLQEFIESSTFEKMPYIPVTRHRAISHINNPRATDKDILMILVWEEDQMLGYLELLPDYFYIEGEEIKVCWMTSIWVHPEARGMGISKNMIHTAIEAYKENVVLTEYTSQAGSIFKKMGFTQLVNLRGIRIYNKSALHQVLPSRHSLFSKTKGLLKAVDNVVNIFSDLPMKPSYEMEGYEAQIVSEIDDETEHFIKMHQYDHITLRRSHELNWLINYPWILEDQIDISDKYAFSAYARKYNLTNIKLRNYANELAAFFIIVQRDESIKVPYAYYRQEAVPAVVHYLYNFIRSNGVSMTTFFHTELVEYANKNIGTAIFSKKINRPYLSTNKLKNIFSSVSPRQIQDGDGDCSFT